MLQTISDKLVFKALRFIKHGQLKLINYDGNKYSFGEEGKGYIRISFANSKENISEALNRIEDFVNKL